MSYSFYLSAELTSKASVKLRSSIWLWQNADVVFVLER